MEVRPPATRRLAAGAHASVPSRLGRAAQVVQRPTPPRRRRGCSPSTARSRTRRRTCVPWWWATSTTRRCTVSLARPCCRAGRACGQQALIGHVPCRRRPPLFPPESLLREYCDFSKQERCIGDAMIGESSRRACDAASRIVHSPATCPATGADTAGLLRPQHRAGQHAVVGVPRAALHLPQLPAAARVRGAGAADLRPRRLLQARRVAGGARLFCGIVLPRRLQARRGRGACCRLPVLLPSCAGCCSGCAAAAVSRGREVGRLSHGSRGWAGRTVPCMSWVPAAIHGVQHAQLAGQCASTAAQRCGVRRVAWRPQALHTRRLAPSA